MHTWKGSPRRGGGCDAEFETVHLCHSVNNVNLRLYVTMCTSARRQTRSLDSRPPLFLQLPAQELGLSAVNEAQIASPELDASIALAETDACVGTRCSAESEYLHYF